MPSLARLAPRCSAAAMASTSENRSLIYVYTGKGASARSALSAARSLASSLPLADVRTLSTTALLEGSWSRRRDESTSSATASDTAAVAAALVMPGGADLPYCADLNGRGNELIRGFVEEGGGSYVGLCAGAYYGCSRVEFELDSEKLAVEGDRELAFFPGAALGAVVPGFRYEAEAGAAATKLLWRRKGGEARQEWSECLDYCNGGPVFVLRGGEEGAGEPSRRVPDECEAGGVAVEVLARYEENASSSSFSPAIAAASRGGAAAVRCRVGKGIVVLCGTHPELRPARESLFASSSGNGGEKSSTAAAATTTATTVLAVEDKKVSSLASALDDPAASRERERYWESLLDAAGLGGLRGGGGGD